MRGVLHLGFLVLALLTIASAAAHFEIRRGCRPRRALALALAQRIHHPEIMLGVLIEVFRRDPVAAGLRLPCHRDIALEDLVGVAANFHARPVAVECLHALRQARPVVMRAAAAAMRPAAASMRPAAAAVTTT